MQFCSWLILLVAVESHSNSTATTKGFWSPICYVCCILLAAFIVLMQHNTRALVAWGHAIFNIKRIYTRLTKTMLFQLNMGTKMLMLVSYKSCLPYAQDILVPGGYTQCSRECKKYIHASKTTNLWSQQHSSSWRARIELQHATQHMHTNIISFRLISAVY